jgi:hypothetical protein
MTYIEFNSIFGIIEFMYILYMKKTVLIKRKVLTDDVYEYNIHKGTLQYTRYYRQHMTLGDVIISLFYCLTPFMNALYLVWMNTFWVFGLIESKDLVLNPKSSVYKIYAFYKGHCGFIQKINDYIKKFFNTKIF